MPAIPHNLIDSLKEVKGFDKEAFENVHASGKQITSIRFNPSKIFLNEKKLKENSEGNLIQDSPSEFGWTELALGGKIPWAQNGYYLKERPSFIFDPLLHAGCYYVQEASSMFLEEIFRQHAELLKPLKVLDLCAAPGGKSTHIQSLINEESLLVSNEVIRSRANVLTENMIKWGGDNVIVTCNDPADFQSMQGFFDVIVVDAPCSGSGLFRRDEEAIAEWSENNVVLCSQRQQRILADIVPALKKDGLLIYSTCSYSKEEDENIIDWLVDEFGLYSVPVKLREEWRIDEMKTDKNGAYGYRFWPYKTKGEGFFIACFRKEDGIEFTYPRMKAPSLATEKETSILDRYLKISGKYSFLSMNNEFYAIPSSLKLDADFLKTVLNVKYAGTKMGQIINDTLVPAHAFAVSTIIAAHQPAIELTKEESLQYLRKQELNLEPNLKGWLLVRYKSMNLGWIKILPNRINNYYPKEWRILKQ